MTDWVAVREATLWKLNKEKEETNQMRFKNERTCQHAVLVVGIEPAVRTALVATRKTPRGVILVIEHYCWWWCWWQWWWGGSSGADDGNSQ